MAKTALLVIDVQRGIFEQRIKVYKAEEMLAKINLLAEKAHQAGAPVVYIQHSNDKFLIYGSDLWQFHPEIKPQPGDLHIHKQHGNAFIETELEEKLPELGVARIVCCGSFIAFLKPQTLGIFTMRAMVSCVIVMPEWGVLNATIGISTFPATYSI